MAKTSTKQNTSAALQKLSSDDRLTHGEHQKNKHDNNHISSGKKLARAQTDTADYIVEMLAVLSKLARDADLRFLNYLLEMAYEESLSHANKTTAIVKSQAQ